MRLCDTDIERHLDEGKIVIEPRPGVERICDVLGYSLKTKYLNSIYSKCGHKGSNHK